MKMASSLSPTLFAPHELSSTPVAASSVQEPPAKTILVVDDEPDIRFLLQVLMTTSGYNVVAAVDGIEALSRITQQVPDLILLDISMPNVDGLNVLRVIRANEPTSQVPIILVSALGNDTHIAEGKEAGANYYVPKPFDSQVLLALVQSLLSPTL